MKPRSTSVRKKLLYLVLAATAPLVLAVTLAMITMSVRIWRNAISSIEDRTTMLHRAVDTTLRESIVGYLTAKTETALTTIEMIENTADHLPQDLVVDRIAQHLLSTRVARSGYIYVIDSTGRIVIHPDEGTQGRVIPEIEPVRTQLAMRNGYIEYTWQNTFEPLPLPKALNMQEYAPREWIVSASAYREEFVDLVDRDRLKNLVAAYAVNSTSYSVIVDRAGVLIVHPDFPGQYLEQFFDAQEAERIMALLFSNPGGQVRYSWPDTTTGERQPKILVFRYMPDFDWAIATTIDMRTLRRPILLLGLGTGVLVFVLVAVVIVLVLRMSHTVSDPIVHLAEAVETGRRVDPEGLNPQVPRELKRLVNRFNTFIDRIDQQQASLRQNVKEKTVLIRELHHRVKNNLQVIASLLSLQSESVADERDSVLFDRSRDRVLSMALVHEQLYQTDDLFLIPFDLYLQDLIGHILGSVRPEDITLEVSSEPVLLNIDLAVPCGMIVNELVNNAFEHAFKGGETGSICVSMRTDGTVHVLEVADSGRGLTDNPRQSLGMTLVRMLVEQIGGTLDITVHKGTAFRVTFSPEPARVALRQSRESP